MIQSASSPEPSRAAFVRSPAGFDPARLEVLHATTKRFVDEGKHAGIITLIARDAMADGVLVIRQFWPFCVNDAIEVHHAKTGLGDFCGGGGQHFGRVAASIGRLGIGKQAADVGQGGGAEQGVGDRV